MSINLKYWPVIVCILSIFSSAAIYMHSLDMKVTLIGEQAESILTEVKLSSQLYDEKTNSRLSLVEYKVEKCGCD